MRKNERWENIVRQGQRVEALMDSGVCHKGERGVVYETYRLGTRDGASVIFERGGYDGFSPDEQWAMLRPLEEFDVSAQAYRFTNVGRLSADFRRGLFQFRTKKEVESE